MTKIDGCIRYWKDRLKQTGYLLSPSTDTIITSTITFLEELRDIIEGDAPDSVRAKYTE